MPEVRAGFDGLGKAGRWLPVQVVVASVGTEELAVAFLILVLTTVTYGNVVPAGTARAPGVADSLSLRGTLMRLLDPSPVRGSRSPVWLAPVLAGGIVLAASCSSDQGVTIPSAPTLQAAATQVGGAASTAVTVATSAAQAGGTAIAGAAPVATSAANAGATAVTAAGPAATSAANAAATAAAIASPVVTRVATAASQLRATADASTPMNSVVGGDRSATPGTPATPEPVATPRVTGSPVSSAPGAAGASGRMGGSASGSAAGGEVSSSAPGGTPVQIAGVGLMAGYPILTLQNATDQSVDLAGWQLEVDGDAVVLPPNARIRPGGSIVLHLADGGSRDSDLYLGRESADLVRGLQPGARLALLDTGGQRVTEAIVPTL